MIIDTKASQDLFNVIELTGMTQWLREQDMSQSTMKLTSSPRTVEERASGIYIRKPENPYAAIQYPIKLGVGLKDGERWYDFKAPTNPAASIAEYESLLIVYMLERIEELSLAWTVPILSATLQAYQFVAKCRASPNSSIFWKMKRRMI
jgi:hypothetical protein